MQLVLLHVPPLQLPPLPATTQVPPPTHCPHGWPEEPHAAAFCMPPGTQELPEQHPPQLPELHTPASFIGTWQ